MVHEMGRLEGSGEPDSALKYLFGAGPVMPRTGNAADHYRRAMGLLAEAEEKFEGEARDWQFNWVGRQDSWPMDEVRDMLAATAEVRAAIQAGAECEYCEWITEGSGLRNTEETVEQLRFDTARQLSRLDQLLSLEAQYAIQVGDYERAAAAIICTLEINRDEVVPQSELSNLEAASHFLVALARIRGWMARPESPNLYWALTSLKARLAEKRLRHISEARRRWMEIEAFREPLSRNWSHEEWLASLDRDFRNVLPLKDATPEQMRLVLSIILVRGFPMAKERLVAEGWNAAELDELPAAQVVCLYESINLSRLMDNGLKWSLLSLQEQRQAANTDSIEFRRADLPGRLPFNPKFEDTQVTPYLFGNEIMFNIATPPSWSVVDAISERHLVYVDGMRAVEALRMHVSITGEVPQSLGEIRVVPVPNDPRTGKPFNYRVTDETVEIILPQVYDQGLRDIVYRFER